MPGKCAGSILILSRPKDWNWQKNARTGSCREIRFPEAVPTILIPYLRAEEKNALKQAV